MTELITLAIIFYVINYIKAKLPLGQYSFFKTLQSKTNHPIMYSKLFYCQNCCAFWITFVILCTLHYFGLSYFTYDYSFLYALAFYNFNNANENTNYNEKY